MLSTNQKPSLTEIVVCVHTGTLVGRSADAALATALWCGFARLLKAMHASPQDSDEASATPLPPLATLAQPTNLHTYSALHWPLASEERCR